MPIPHPRLTVRRLMIAVAVIAVGLTVWMRIPALADYFICLAAQMGFCFGILVIFILLEERKFR